MVLRQVYLILLSAIRFPFRYQFKIGVSLSTLSITVRAMRKSLALECTEIRVFDLVRYTIYLIPIRLNTLFVPRYKGILRLDFSRNPQLYMQNLEPGPRTQLETLVLNGCNVSVEEIKLLLYKFPTLQELHVGKSDNC